MRSLLDKLDYAAKVLSAVADCERQLVIVVSWPIFIGSACALPFDGHFSLAHLIAPGSSLLFIVQSYVKPHTKHRKITSADAAGNLDDD